MKKYNPKRKAIYIVSIKLLVLGLLAMGAGGQAREFSELKQTVAGQILDVLADDLDGDGRKEMLVSVNMHQDSTTERYLHIYGWSDSREFRRLQLRETWKVTPDAVFWDVGKAGDGSGERHLYFVSSDGLWELGREGSQGLQPRLRIKAPVFVASGQEDDFRSMNFIKDWDGDKAEEVFLPLSRKALFFKQTGQGDWKQSDSIPITLFSNYNNNIMNGIDLGIFQYLSVLFYPLLVPQDFNNDGRLDMMALRSGQGFCFLRDEDGKLTENPDIWDLDIRSRIERIRKQANLSYRVADLNQDGFADVVTHKVGSNFTDLNTETAVFLGRPDRPRPREPDYRFVSQGLLSGCSFKDLDGDGYEDMILWTVKAGLWPFIEIILRRIIRVEINYFYGTWPEGFSEKPQHRRLLGLDLDMAWPDYLQGTIPNHDGDFNGDGLLDLVASKGADKLEIYLGRPRKGFDSRSWSNIPASGINRVTPVDLNNDDHCDLYGCLVGEDESVLHLWLQIPDK